MTSYHTFGGVREGGRVEIKNFQQWDQNRNNSSSEFTQDLRLRSRLEARTTVTQCSDQ